MRERSQNRAALVIWICLAVSIVVRSVGGGVNEQVRGTQPWYLRITITFTYDETIIYTMVNANGTPAVYRYIIIMCVYDINP